MLESIKELVASAPQIRAEIDRLQRLLAIIDEYEGNGEDVAVSSPAGSTPARKSGLPDTHKPQGRPVSIASDEFVGLSTSQAVKRYLELVGRGNPKGPRDMAKALVKGGRDADEEKAYANVASVLKKMKKTGEVRQVRRGEWGLSTWYGAAKAPTRSKGPGDNGIGEDSE